MFVQQASAYKSTYGTDSAAAADTAGDADEKQPLQYVI